jgi:hypothetical protein
MAMGLAVKLRVMNQLSLEAVLLLSCSAPASLRATMAVAKPYLYMKLA